jgi:hypothetical protein
MHYFNGGLRDRDKSPKRTNERKKAVKDTDTKEMVPHGILTGLFLYH